MELIDIVRPRQEKIEEWLERALLGVACTFSLYWLLTFGFSSDSAISVEQNLPLPSLHYSQVGKGPLAISPSVTPSLDPLVKEFILLGQNTRPDAGSDQGTYPSICLGLKSSGSKKEIFSGQRFFIDDQKGLYIFTDVKTERAVTAWTLNEGQVLLQIEAGQGPKEEVVLSASTLFQPSLEAEAYVQSLKKGKFWGNDLFLNQWGGEEYRELGSRYKIELDQKIFFLSVGEMLWWDGDQWQTGNAKNSQAPVAKLTASTVGEVKIAVWDGSGYVSSIVHLPLQYVPRSPLKPDEVMTSVRSHSPSEITCQLGKRRVVVKEGDWWVKNLGRWRPLRTAEALEAFLQHQIPGELFIFEKIESGKGKITLKGRSFDKMRTLSEPLALTFSTEKKLSSPSKKETPRASLLAKNKMKTPLVHQHSLDEEEKP